MAALNLTFMRCNKVEKALEADKNVRALLGAKEHIVHKPPPNNTPVKFSEPVIAITAAIIATGEDPYSWSQQQIRAFSLPILADHRDGKALPKYELPSVQVPETKAEPKPKKPVVVKSKAKPAPAKKKSVAKPEVAAKPQAAAKPEPVAEPEAEVPAPDPEHPARHNAPQFTLGLKPENKATPARSTAPAAEALPQPLIDDARTAPAGSLPYVWGVSVNTMYLSILQLLEQAGLRDSSLWKRTAELSNEVTKLTVIPRNAKESQSSPNRLSAP